MQTESFIGKKIICAETGKEFIGATDGFTTNYARDSEGIQKGIYIPTKVWLPGKNGNFWTAQNPSFAIFQEMVSISLDGRETSWDVSRKKPKEEDR